MKDPFVMSNHRMDILKVLNESHLPHSLIEYKEVLEVANRFTSWDPLIDLDYDEALSNSTGRDYWVVTRDFKFYIDDERTKWVYVPYGFKTDGASVPFKFLRKFIEALGSHTRGVVVHDVLCVDLRLYTEEGLIHITQKEADKIMLLALKVTGVGWFKRHVMYYAVRFYQKFILGA